MIFENLPLRAICSETAKESNVMTDTASQFLGDIPGNYDTYMGPNIFADYADELAARAASLNPKRVLELAAGTGIVSRRLRDQLSPDSRLLSTDLNAPMLDFARSKFQKGERIEFAVADAMDLKLDGGPFDQVVCQFGVMFFPDKLGSFRQVKRVLKPGSVYLFNTWGTQDENPFAQIAQSLAEELFPDDPPGFYRVPFSCADPSVVTRDLNTAGFDSVSHEEVCLSKDVTSWSDFARGIVFGNPFGEEVRNRGTDPEDLVGKVEHGLRDRFGDEPGPMPLKAHFFCARAA